MKIKRISICVLVLLLIVSLGYSVYASSAVSAMNNMKEGRNSIRRRFRENRRIN